MTLRGSVWVYDEQYHYSVDHNETTGITTVLADPFVLNDVKVQLHGNGPTLRAARADLAHYIRCTVDHLKTQWRKLE